MNEQYIVLYGRRLWSVFRVDVKREVAVVGLGEGGKYCQTEWQLCNT